MSEPKKEAVLPAFQSFLLSHGLAPEKHIPFYAYWASRFLAFCNTRDVTDPSMACLEFAHALMADQKIAEWQVKQAEDAIRLYLTHFKADMKPEFHGLRGETGLSAERLIEETKRLIRVKHYSYSTERTYIDWITRFFQYMQDVRGLRAGRPAPEDVRNYLTHLAVKKHVSSSTQNQALNALLFLFRDVLNVEMGDISGTVRAKRGQRLPVVLSTEEVKSIFKHLSGTALLIAHLLYGAGLRLMELARMRVMDVDFDMNVITVRTCRVNTINLPE